MPARTHQRDDGQVQRGLPGRGGDGGDAPLHGGHPFLQHRDGGVGHAAVDVTGHVLAEHRRGGVGVLEHERGAAVDRGDPCPRRGIGPGARMDGEGVEAGAIGGDHAPGP